MTRHAPSIFLRSAPDTCEVPRSLYPMTSQWHLSRDGKTYGIFSPEQLRTMAQSGELQPTDLVWKTGMPKWVSARRIKNLFPKDPSSKTQSDDRQSDNRSGYL